MSNINNPATTFSISVYPNPLAANGILEIENKETGAAKVQWYNYAGQKIKEQALGILTKGTHKISLAADDNLKIAPGVYLIRVQIKNQSQTQKIVLF